VHSQGCKAGPERGEGFDYCPSLLPLKRSERGADIRIALSADAAAIAGLINKAYRASRRPRLDP